MENGNRPEIYMDEDDKGNVTYEGPIPGKNVPEVPTDDGSAEELNVATNFRDGDNYEDQVEVEVEVEGETTPPEEVESIL